MSWLKNIFGVILRVGEGYLKTQITIEQPLWFYIVVIGGAFGLGALVHAVL